jgi:hypothetical protein
VMGSSSFVVLPFSIFLSFLHKVIDHLIWSGTLFRVLFSRYSQSWKFDLSTGMNMEGGCSRLLCK